MKSILVLLIASSLLGCQSTPRVNLSHKLEGSQHKVWKEAAYLNLRNELKDGEIIIFKNVESRWASRLSDYQYFGDIYSLDGQKLFNQKYELYGVGVIAHKGHEIIKTISPDVINSTRGIQYHGNTFADKGRTVYFWKTNGGDAPKALPMIKSNLYSDFLYQSDQDERLDTSGLFIGCSSGDVYLSLNNPENIFAAVGESITITVYYPYNVGKKYTSKAISHTGFLLRVDDYLERILLEEDAIKLEAYSQSNKQFSQVTAYNNGLAEAYMRVKNNCRLQRDM